MDQFHPSVLSGHTLEQALKTIRTKDQGPGLRAQEGTVSGLARAIELFAQEGTVYKKAQSRNVLPMRVVCEWAQPGHFLPRRAESG